MENLRHSAANGGEDTYDVLYLPTTVEIEPEFKVDLSIEGIAKDVIDRERMGKIQEVVDN